MYLDKIGLDFIRVVIQLLIMLVTKNLYYFRWEPRYHREASTKFYAKKGISWHLIVIEILAKNEATGALEIQTNTFVHVVENSVPQDHLLVEGILRHTLTTFTQYAKGIKEIHLRSDQAGKQLVTL